jgi:hypothetical protein
MKFSLQVLVTVVLLVLAGGVGAARTASQSEGIRRLDESEHVTFDPSIVGPCINLPATNTEKIGQGWSYAISPEHNDDLFSDPIPLGFEFLLFGDQYGLGTAGTNQVIFVNNNGNLSFRNGYGTYTSTGFPVAGFPMIAPFWADVDTRPDLGHAWKQDFSSGGRNVFAVTYENVGYFSQQGDKNNSFQVLISDGNDAAMGVGNNVCFCYANMDWTTGSASSGVNGFGGTPATVGANKGDGTDFFQIGRFNRSGSDFSGPTGISGVDFLDNKGFCFNAGGVDNVLPIAVGFPNGNITLNRCASMLVPVAFLSPEAGQTVNVVVTPQPLPPGFTLTIASPNPEQITIDIQFDPVEDGTYTLTFVATDSASGTTTQDLTFVVSGCDCNPDPAGGGCNGDPHFKTWRGKHFDYHGECDLVLLNSSAFESGLGLDVHIRTKIRRDMSYISSAALRIGSDVLEVESQGVYYLNGVLSAVLPAEFSGFAFSHTQPTNKQHVFEVYLGGRERIKLKTYKDFVSVLIEQGQKKHFGDSAGLMGDFTTGRMIGRDGKTVIDDANAFGQEWQVLETESSLFHTVRLPQHPNVCTMPPPMQASQVRRRLLSESSSVDQLAAEKACEQWGEGKDDCVFDVLTTGDLEMAVVGAY